MALRALLAIPLTVALYLASATAAAPPPRDPAALDALKRMGAYLRTLNSFEVTSTGIVQEVRDAAGDKTSVQISANYKVRRPNGFLLEMAMPHKMRRFYYDGRAFTVFAPKVGYFASVSAPPTISQAVKKVYDDYGIVLPVADLFYWGSDAMPTDGVTRAQALGPETVGGFPTDHYRFASPQLVWEVWIKRGPQPLPLKMRIVSTEVKGHPVFTTSLRWKTAVSFPPATFVFSPSKDAKPIVMARTDQWPH